MGKDSHPGAIQKKIEELGIPQVTLTFTFDNGESYTIPISRDSKLAVSLTINHIPEFETSENLAKLVSEEIQLIVNYGRGIIS